MKCQACVEFADFLLCHDLVLPFSTSITGKKDLYSLISLQVKGTDALPVFSDTQLCHDSHYTYDSFQTERPSILLCQQRPIPIQPGRGLLLAHFWHGAFEFIFSPSVDHAVQSCGRHLQFHCLTISRSIKRQIRVPKAAFSEFIS